MTLNDHASTIRLVFENLGPSQLVDAEVAAEIIETAKKAEGIVEKKEGIVEKKVPSIQSKINEYVFWHPKGLMLEDEEEALEEGWYWYDEHGFLGNQHPCKTEEEAIKALDKYAADFISSL